MKLHAFLPLVTYPEANSASIAPSAVALARHLDADLHALALEADFLAVRELLRGGRVGEALAAYAGPILPYSEAPSIVEAREALDYSLREAVLASGDIDLLHAWVESTAGREDLDACRRLATALPRGDRRRAAVLSHLRRLSGGL